MTYVSAQLRKLVIERANQRCEYCLFPQSAALFSFEMEHIRLLAKVGVKGKGKRGKKLKILSL